VALTTVPSLVGVESARKGVRAVPKQVRIGVVGGGFGADFQWHLHPNSKMTAVCDLREERIQKLKRVYKCDTSYNTQGLTAPTWPRAPHQSATLRRSGLSHPAKSAMPLQPIVARSRVRP